MKSDVEEEDLPTASVNDHCSIDYFETKFTEASTTTTIHIHDESTRIVKESLSQAGHDPRDQSKGEIAAYSTRHGARNQNRHKIICKWLLERFPRLPKNSMVLDVAGGKGELSSRLAMCHHLRVVMVDPRPADIVSVYTKTVVPKLPLPAQQQRRATQHCLFLGRLLGCLYLFACLLPPLADHVHSSMQNTGRNPELVPGNSTIYIASIYTRIPGIPCRFHKPVPGVPMVLRALVYQDIPGRPGNPLEGPVAHILCILTQFRLTYNDSSHNTARYG